MNFATLKGLTIPEGNVTKITDASGRVLWSAIREFIGKSRIRFYDCNYQGGPGNYTLDYKGLDDDGISYDAVQIDGKAYSLRWSLVREQGTRSIYLGEVANFQDVSFEWWSSNPRDIQIMSTFEFEEIVLGNWK